jgi:hypothetical protein
LHPFPDLFFFGLICFQSLYFVVAANLAFFTSVLGETRDFQVEFGRDDAFATTAEAVSSAPDVLNQDKLALVDMQR